MGVNVMKRYCKCGGEHKRKDCPYLVYFKGDLATLTGKKEKLYGATFREIILLDGHMKGEKRLIK